MEERRVLELCVGDRQSEHVTEMLQIREAHLLLLMRGVRALEAFARSQPLTV